MIALTVRQPHAWAILAGIKPFENRTWTTRYRGPLLIHAGMSWDRLDDGPRYEGEPHRSWLTFGAILGVADLVAVAPVEQVEPHPTATGPRCWSLANPRWLREPVRCRGAQGLWRPDPEVAARVRDALAGIGQRSPFEVQG